MQRRRVSVAFRDESFELGPGQRVILPLLSAGGAPIEPDLASQRISGEGFTVHVSGDFEPLPDEIAVHLRAREPVEVQLELGGQRAERGRVAVEQRGEGRVEPMPEQGQEAAPEEGAGSGEESS